MKRPVRLTTRSALLMALLILTLASLSIGNALWSESLVINESVATGWMSVRWRNDGTSITQGENDPLNVAQVSCYRDSTNFHLVHVDLTNVYPGYEASCSFKWLNDGTIPVQVQYLDINGTPLPPNSEDPVSLNVGGDSQPDLEVALSGQVSAIYDPPPPNHGGSNQITVMVLPGAPQLTTLTFTAHVNLIQAPHPAP